MSVSDTPTADPSAVVAPDDVEPEAAVSLAAAQLELSLHPDDVERLARLPEFSRLRAGRARTSTIKVVWADTPDGTLAGEGLGLGERRVGRETVWRLERLRGTPQAPWLPGTPEPIVAETASLADLHPKPPDQLVPVAACDGTVRSYRLTGTSGPMTLTLLHATLRAVTQEGITSRLLLSGPPADVEALALALAQSIRVSVPNCSLAAEALALAGRVVAPRSLGAPALWHDATVSVTLAALVGHFTDVILYWAPLAVDGTALEPVHQMRVALRRLRSAMSLFRRAIDEAMPSNWKSELRNLLQVLGPARDWDVFIAGIGRDLVAAMPDDRPVAKLLAAAERQRQDAYASLRDFIGGVAFRQLCIRLACLAAFRPWEALSMDDSESVMKRHVIQAASLRAFAEHALTRRVERVLDAGDDLSGLSATELHALRIQGKRLRYAIEFFAPLYPGRATRRFLRRSTALQERLGHVNDNAVAAALMATLSGGGADRSYAVGVVRGYVAARQHATRGKLARIWQKFRRADPFWR